MSDKIATETVYVTNEESHVMSEKVQHLAASVYKEFEKVIKRYDEEVVKDLMPLVVGILETLDAAFTEKQELDVEIELLRDDNEQLLTQYEREKQYRKAAEQKYMELEDSSDGIRTELEDKVDALESILRMSEIKAKNAADHVNRLEEKEQEMKLEHNKLNERYLELLRNHVDYRERTKMSLGNDKLSELSGMSPKIMKGNLHGVRPISLSYGTIVDLHNPHDSFDTGTPHSTANVSLKSELDAQTPKSTEKEQLTDSIDLVEQSAATTTTPELEESQESLESQGSLNIRKSARNDNSIFDELTVEKVDIAEVDFGSNITGRAVNPGDYASSVGDNFFGIDKEVEKLIVDNVELMATKNALNIVKDDLIAKVDELTSEQELLREEITSLQTIKSRLNQRITQLEDELKKAREEQLAKEKGEHGEDDEEKVDFAQRKRFTRVEMARVLMERNQYKERLMELQEAVRWTEMIRASKNNPQEIQTKKKSSVWNFFSELVAPSFSTPTASSPVQIPARHQSVLQAVLNPSLHQHSASSSSHDHDMVDSSISLLPSPSQSSLSSLAHITLLPPPESSAVPTSGPVPVLLSSDLSAFNPTLTGGFLTSSNHCNPPPDYHNLKLSTPLPPVPKSQKPTSTLPGIHPIPDHPVRHL